ncbi:probable carbohydrate esterase At4g34215 [Salvia splendens]|uniref:probable carbohydrate esterase At4g34215 n=1 Tax=Salvia splendens TaxID=180675 RepID=UPI001C266B30|nr:probable carbohydrate esterase At4g34215 [Salvia splendens]
MNSIGWLTLLCCSTIVSCIDQPQNIFILAGQSNMVGRGGLINGVLDPHVPAECQPSPKILRLNVKLAWEVAHDPLHMGIDPKVVGIGPGMSFANTMLAKDPTIGVIGLIPCAIGGTKIDEWAKGMKLYNDMIDRSKAAIKDGGALRALLWYQGESDTKFLQDTESYKAKFEKFIADVRADLQMPTLPVVQVLITSGDGFVEEWRANQQAIKVANLKQVDAKGLELLTDNVHLSTAGEVKLGQMLADAFLQF